MNKRRRVFVAQYADVSNNNPQVLNTRALLSRFKDEDCEWLVPYFGEPDPVVATNPNVTLIKLWPWRFWKLHKFLLYQLKVDAAFYPGPYWFDDLALQLRRLTGRKVPVITTLEGLGGDADRQRTLSEWAGHPVYCQQVPPSLMRRIDRVQREADHVIAISPFLARMGSRLYGDKFSNIQLGIETTTFFHPASTRNDRFTVIGVGSFQKRKRPEVFLELASRFPLADFVWYGDGEDRQRLLNEKKERNIVNVNYPGPMPNHKLADEYRKADLFVLPANSEGVPKVTQEAAACGLPVIIFGFYEAPSVINGENGFVVWNDDELFVRVGELIDDPEKARRMGECGAEMAKEWDWDSVAARWETKLLEILNR
ncbi:MAG: glycosyltransferase [Desulfuromonadaceae bacterium]|nr:glycosyltransferase [Desulfuromonadaceae bacterium]